MSSQNIGLKPYHGRPQRNATSVNTGKSHGKPIIRICLCRVIAVTGILKPCADQLFQRNIDLIVREDDLQVLPCRIAHLSAENRM
jgi:hypothetical protein